jgi:predicted transglutaminase-like cysteine proteinase
MEDRIFKQVKNLFIWTSDKEVFKQSDHWKSFADEVERGEVFKGDCDDFSLTCAELLVRNGTALDRIKLVLCKVETGTGHLVCISRNLVLDNRQRKVLDWSELPYTWISSMGMDELGIWKTVPL